MTKLFWNSTVKVIRKFSDSSFIKAWSVILKFHLSANLEAHRLFITQYAVVAVCANPDHNTLFYIPKITKTDKIPYIFCFNSDNISTRQVICVPANHLLNNFTALILAQDSISIFRCMPKLVMTKYNLVAFLLDLLQGADFIEKMITSKSCIYYLLSYQFHSVWSNFLL